MHRMRSKHLERATAQTNCAQGCTARTPIEFDAVARPIDCLLKESWQGLPLSDRSMIQVKNQISPSDLDDKNTPVEREENSRREEVRKKVKKRTMSLQRVQSSKVLAANHALEQLLSDVEQLVSFTIVGSSK